MTDDFDPYYRWLAIPPEEQPPNHYRLLGVKQFENDLDVIATAADRQMAHLRTFQTGQHWEASQRLLNEIALARICLLNAGKRAEYDRGLAARMRATPHDNIPRAKALDAAPPPPPPPRHDALSELEELTGSTYQPRRKRPTRGKGVNWPVIAPVALCLIGLAIVVAIAYVLWRGK